MNEIINRLVSKKRNKGIFHLGGLCLGWINKGEGGGG